MRSLSTLSALAAVTSSAFGQAARTQGAPAVVGVWQIILPSGAPSACFDMSVEFRRDGTMLTRSGALLATNTYSLQRKKEGWLLVMGRPRTNGQPNCQGLPADFVVQNFVAREYVKVAGDTLRECNADSSVPDCLAMVRKEARHSGIDSVMAILDAYAEHRVSAASAAKVIVDYISRTKEPLNVQMDPELREAVAKELKAREGSR